MTKDEIKHLAEKVVSGIASDEEILLYNRLYNSLQAPGFDWDENIHGNKEEWKLSMKAAIWGKTKINKRVIYLKWLKWTTAAAAVILIVFGSYYVFTGNGKRVVADKTLSKKQQFKNDRLPGGEKAILTLADGSSIVLDSTVNGIVAKQGTTKIVKLKGKIAYDAAASGPGEITFNTLSTPPGGTYQIELPDGSLVWLNAASSLRFPTAFAGKERRVEITGEAYFEVAKNKTMPFIVKVNNAEVRVLGTHFNVMAYSNESSIKTTLLEGAVQFFNGNDNVSLQPGQQSLLSTNGQLQLMSGVNVSDAIAWKEGLFHFEDVSIETVMRQLSRWYDVEVVYENKKPDELFYIEMPRTSKLSDVLKVLELSAGIHFEIDGKQIKVKT